MQVEGTLEDLILLIETRKKLWYVENFKDLQSVCPG